MKVIAMLSVYKKPKERALTVSTSKNYILETWINLLSPLYWCFRGLLTIWNSNLFDGSVVQANSYAVIVRLFCRLDNKTFLLQTFMVLPTLYRNRDLLHGS